MGTLQQNFCPCGGGNVGTYSRGECGDFASFQLRGDWQRLIVHSINGKMAEEKKNGRYVFFAKPYTFVINWDKFRTAYQLLKIEKVDFFYFHKNVNF